MQTFLDGVRRVVRGISLLLLAALIVTPLAQVLMRGVFNAHPEVTRVIALRTQHVGPDDIMVNAKLEFDPTLTVARLAAVVNELEVELRTAEPKARTIFIEPDVFRAPEDVAHL